METLYCVTPLLHLPLRVTLHGPVLVFVKCSDVIGPRQQQSPELAPTGGGHSLLAVPDHDLGAPDGLPGVAVHDEAPDPALYTLQHAQQTLQVVTPLHVKLTFSSGEPLVKQWW